MEDILWIMVEINQINLPKISKFKLVEELSQIEFLFI